MIYDFSRFCQKVIYDFKIFNNGLFEDNFLPGNVFWVSASGTMQAPK
jgi:hypothetical protein